MKLIGLGISNNSLIIIEDHLKKILRKNFFHQFDKLDENNQKFYSKIIEHLQIDLNKLNLKISIQYLHTFSIVEFSMFYDNNENEFIPILFQSIFV